MRLVSTLVAIVLGSLASFPARADDDTERARQTGADASRAFEQHHYQAAADAFRSAELLSHSPTYLLGLARSLAALNRVVAAEQVYVALTEEGAPAGASPADPQVTADAKRELDDVRSREAHVTITVTGARAPYVVLDDVPIPITALGTERAVDPGEHTARATARGSVPAVTRFTAVEGAKIHAVLAMAAAPEVDAEGGSAAPAVGMPPANATDGSREPTGTPPAESAGHQGLSGYRISAYVAFGVGAVGLVVGIAEGIRASDIRSQLAATCAPNCTQSDVDRVRAGYTLSGAGYVTAALGVAAGITLIVLEPRPLAHSGVSVSPYVSAGGPGLVGWF